MEHQDMSLQTKEFQSHLAIQGNHRVIFSGKFGSGKTYFLKQFFEAKLDGYINIRLAPVNYVVASNQDVFELIKFDLLLQLLKFNVFEKEDIQALVKLPYFLNKNAYQIVKFIVEKSIPVGKDIVEIAEKLSGFVSDFETFARKDEKDDAKKYLNSFTTLKGSIHEEDQFTNLICSCIQKLKSGQNSNKKIILTIDDLDRIDPEHIFRLFNIFSAHIDLEMSSESVLHNKFGFDQIIFVCDIDNIRNIYHAKYGNNVDFAGYIGKYFSKEIFYFDIKDVLLDLLWAYVNKLDFTIEARTQLKSYIYRDVFEYILKSLIHNKAINIRLLNNTFQLKKNFIPNTHKNNSNLLLTDYTHFPIALILDFLFTILGDYQKLYDSIKSCQDNKMLKQISCNKFLPLLLAVYHIEQNAGKDESGDYSVIINQDIIVNYKIREYDNPYFEVIGDSAASLNFYHVLKDVLNILRDKYHMYI